MTTYNVQTRSAKFISGLTIVMMLATVVLPFTYPKTANAADGSMCGAQTSTVTSTTATLADGSPSEAVGFIHPAWTASMQDATWIWKTATVADTTVDQTVVFTQPFSISGTPVDSTLTIASDNDYTVTIGSLSVVDTSGDSFGSPDTITIPAADLVTGINTLTISVKNRGTADSTFETNPAGLMFSLTANGNVDCGTLIVTNYACPEGTTVTRSANGVGMSVPEGCTLQSGATYGYTYEAGRIGDTGAPYPGITDSTPWTPLAVTDSNGLSTNTNMPTGRYLVAETVGTAQGPQNGVLGLYCVGDGDTSNTNDNQELTFIATNGATTNCVAYNEAEVVVTPPTAGKVHIMKYIDGVPATPVLADNATFPMFTNFNAPNLGAAQNNVPFTLKAGGWSGTDGDYEATTSTMDAGSSYTAWENTSTDVVGTTCDAGAEYRLDGYSTGSSYATAATATKTTTAPTFTVNGDSYLIVHNHKCGTPEPDTMVTVHIYKYLKSGSTMTQVADDAGIMSFPMSATWDSANLGSGTGSYVLGNNHGGAALKYAANTSPMTAPADYTTSETTGTDVIAAGGQCVEGKYRLVGYKNGDTLAAAEASALSTTAPTYTDISADKHIIVVNELCGSAPTTTTNTTVVTPGNMQGWEFNSDRATWTMGTAEMVSGPATPPLGTGSARLTTPTNDERTKLRKYMTAGIQISDITELKYSTFRANPDTGALTMALQFDVDFGTTPINAAKADARIVYEPYHTQQSEIVNDAWQQWDTLNDAAGTGTGAWWVAGAGGAVPCQQSNPCTWAELNAAFPDMQTSAKSLENTIDTQGAVLFKAGGSWATFDGNVDKLVLGIKSGLNTHTETYDFEQAEVIVTPPASNGGGGSSSGFIPSSSSSTTGSVAGASTDSTQTPQEDTGRVLGASCQAYITKYLRFGDAGNDATEVTKLQVFLNEKYNAQLPVTGFYGPATVAAVKKFQKQYSTEVLSPWKITEGTGIVYITTSRMINNIVCPELDLSLSDSLTPWKKA